MRIGIDARFLGPEGTGIGRVLTKLLTQLEHLDRSNDYVVFLRKANWNRFTSLEPNFHKVLADVPWYSLKEQLLLPRLFGKEELDLLFVPHLNIPIFYSGPMVVMIHDLIISEYKSKEMSTKNSLLYNLQHFGYSAVLRQSVRKAERIIVPSTATKASLQSMFPGSERKVVVNYEAADENFGKLKLTQKEIKQVLEKYRLQKPFLLYVGNSFPYKNVTIILQALKTLPKEVKLFAPSAQNKFLERLKEKAKELGVGNRVIFPGYVEDRELAAIYQSAGCFIFPSLAEGFGLPGLEAMSLGLPVVASDIPVFKEVYGDAAVYFDPKDATDLAGRVNLVLSEKKIQEKYIDLGFKQVRKYSWEKFGQKTWSVFQEVLNDSKRS